MHIKSVRFGLAMGFAFAVYYALFALFIRYMPDMAMKIGRLMFYNIVIDPMMSFNDYVFGALCAFICGVALGFLIMLFYNLLVCCRKQECCAGNGKH